MQDSTDKAHGHFVKHKRETVGHTDMDFTARDGSADASRSRALRRMAGGVIHQHG